MAKPSSQFSQKLREAREAAGLTQAEAAQRLHVGAQTVSRWERGEHTVKAHDYERAIALYGSISTGGNRLAENVTNGRYSPGSSRGVQRIRRAEAFEREMVRMGADDFEADHVRIRARSFLESVLSSGGTDDLGDDDLDRELELYLQNNLKVWVVEHMKRRGAEPSLGLGDSRKPR